MKPRTKVPASLLRDLKVFAIDAGSPDVALHLLQLELDAEAAPESSADSLAESLAWVAFHLAEIEARSSGRAVDLWPVKKRDVACLMAAHCARDIERIASLQRRVARVIQALLADRPKGRAA